MRLCSLAISRLIEEMRWKMNATDRMEYVCRHFRPLATMYFDLFCLDLRNKTVNKPEKEKEKP